MSSRQSGNRHGSAVRRSVSHASGTGSSAGRNLYYGSGYDYYTYGSAAPAVNPHDGEREERPARESSGRTKSRSAEKGQRRQMANPVGILSLIFAVIMMSAALFAYIGLQTEVTNAVEEIAELESTLSDLKSDNDEALNAIESGISLDDIKYRAITELGMTYAQEDQIIRYSNDDSDYVRQLIQP